MPLAGGRRSRVRAHCGGSIVSSGGVTVSCCGFAANTSLARAAPELIPHRQGPTFESQWRNLSFDPWLNAGSGVDAPGRLRTITPLFNFAANSRLAERRAARRRVWFARQ